METPPKRWSPDEFYELPDAKRFELVDGRLKERPMSEESSYIGGEIFTYLKIWTRQTGLGWAFPSDQFYRAFRGGEDVRLADASFISRDRLPDGPTSRGMTPFAPDLAVEVIAPGDRAGEIEQKIADYREAGVLLVWVIYPGRRVIHVFRNGSESPNVLTETDTLTGGDVPPGFAVPVADIFPPKPSAGD
ncbi:MAG: Uma2 family endonuclease [Planctomycetota bacterium]